MMEDHVEIARFLCPVPGEVLAHMLASLMKSYGNRGFEDFYVEQPTERFVVVYGRKRLMHDPG